MELTEKDLIDIIPDLRVFARTRSYNQNDADDLVQKTLLRMISKKHLFRGGKLIAWAITIMKNIRTDDLRASKDNITDNVEDQVLPSPDKTDMLEIIDLNNALNALTEKCREVLILIGAGYSYNEISQNLHIEIGTVMSRLNRCREKLTEVMYG